MPTEKQTVTESSTPVIKSDALTLEHIHAMVQRIENKIDKVLTPENIATLEKFTSNPIAKWARSHGRP